MEKVRRRLELRKFYALLENKKNEEFQAVMLMGKCSKGHASFKTRKVMGKDWEVVLVFRSIDSFSSSFRPAHYQALEERVDRGDFLAM